MRLEHHLVGGYVRYISPHIIIILLLISLKRNHVRTHIVMLSTYILNAHHEALNTHLEALNTHLLHVHVPSSQSPLS